MSSPLEITGNDGVRPREEKDAGVPVRIYRQVTLGSRRLQVSATDGGQENLADGPGPDPLGLLLPIVVAAVVALLMPIRLVVVDDTHLIATSAD